MANFNRIAGVYEFLKRLVFAKQIEKASNYFLDQIPSNARILIIGGGAGKILEKFKPAHYITYLELSEAMILRAKRVKSEASINFIQADILEWTTDNKFDLIITPFVLDCFTEDQLNLIFPKLDKMLFKDGKWIQTDFYPKNFGHRLLIKSMYAFFNLTADLKVKELVDFDTVFKKHDFIFKRKALFYHSMVESKIYQKIE